MVNQAARPDLLYMRHVLTDKHSIFRSEELRLFNPSMKQLTCMPMRIYDRYKSRTNSGVFERAQQIST